jgi:hypothetical protein
MSLIMLNPTSFQFRVQPPGTSSSTGSTQDGIGTTSIGLVVDWPNPPTSIPVSLEITGDTAGVFSATLISISQNLRGPFQTSVKETLASTSGAPGSGGTLKPTKADTVTNFYVVVTFKAPAAPAVPGYFTGTVAVSGWGGTATVTLLATTAQVTATPVVSGAGGVFAPTTTSLPDGSVVREGPFVTIDISCAYGDSAPLKVALSLQSQSPDRLSNITVLPQTISIQQQLIKAVNPRNPQWDFWYPDPWRYSKVILYASANANAVAGPGAVKILVSTPDLTTLPAQLVTVNYTLKLP